MKQKTLLASVFSIIFAAILILATIVMPAGTASANQEVNMPATASVNQKGKMQCKDINPKLPSQGNLTMAIRVLKAIIDSDLETSAIYLSLADLYCQSNDYASAKQTYLKTIDQVKADLDINIIIAAKARLADIFAKENKPEEAKRLRNEAAAIWNAVFGDNAVSEDIPDIPITKCGGCPIYKDGRGKQVGLGMYAECIPCGYGEP